MEVSFIRGVILASVGKNDWTVLAFITTIVIENKTLNAGYNKNIFL
jgi:hypothetical protein